MLPIYRSSTVCVNTITDFNGKRFTFVLDSLLSLDKTNLYYDSTNYTLEILCVVLEVSWFISKFLDSFIELCYN
jgi:hypothetical protein